VRVAEHVDALCPPVGLEAARAFELERQQEVLRGLRDAPPCTIRLHPRLAEIYAEKVQQLETSLNASAIREEAAEVLRSLIDRIELSPRGDGKGVYAVLHGDLAEILAFCHESDGAKKLPKTGVSASQLSVVAGTGFVQERTRCELRKTV
jgi:site-specific DNA recombinase